MHSSLAHKRDITIRAPSHGTNDESLCGVFTHTLSCFIVIISSLHPLCLLIFCSISSVRPLSFLDPSPPQLSLLLAHSSVLQVCFLPTSSSAAVGSHPTPYIIVSYRIILSID